MKQILFLLSLLVIASSCQKVIDLEVDDTDPKLVIEANYDAIQEEVKVKISKSINVFSIGKFPEVVGADVEITDKNGVTNTLLDQGDGSYLLENYVPTYNSEYSMKVIVEGTTYTAKDSLVPIVSLDSLHTEFQEQSFIFDEGYTLSLHFQDPVGSNYYRVLQTVNGEYLDEAGDRLLFDDGSTDNEYRDVSIFPEVFEPQDTIEIQLISYSNKTYTYYQEFFDAVSGSEYSTAPANPSSTWSPSCLGNFAAYGYDSDTLVVEE